MASTPPQIALTPATPMGGAPKAVTDKRLTIPAQPHPGAQPVTVANDTPAAQPAPQPAPQPAAQQAPVTPESAPDTSDLSPEIAAFLNDPAVPEVQPAPQPAAQQPAQQPAPQPAAQQAPVTPESAPGPALSFDNLFSPAPEAPPQTGDNAELVALREQMAAMQEMLERPSAAPHIGEVNYDVTPEEQETFGDPTFKVIERIAKAYTEAAVAQVEDRLSALEAQFNQSIDQVQSGVSDMRSRSYTQQLNLQVPDLDQLVNHPAFRSYTEQTVPYSGGVTVGQRITQANSAGELATVVAFMKEFRDSFAGGANDPAVPAIQSMAQPATTAAPAPTVPAQQVTRQPLAWSTRLQAVRELRAGRLTQEKFDRIDLAYRNADKQGLVDYNS